MSETPGPRSRPRRFAAHGSPASLVARNPCCPETGRDWEDYSTTTTGKPHAAVFGQYWVVVPARDYPVLCRSQIDRESCCGPVVVGENATEPLPALDRPIDAGVGGRWHEQLAAQRLGTFRRVRLMLLGPRTRGARLAHAHKERAPQIRSTGENQKEAPARCRRHACQAGP